MQSADALFQFGSELLDLLSKGWVGLLAGAAIAFYTWRRPRNKLQMSCAYMGSRILGVGDDQQLPEGIRVTFMGTPIPRLTATCVAIWNSGDQTIPGDHLATSDPFRIRIEGGDILSAEIAASPRPVNGICISSSADSHHLEVQFEYLDKNDGAIFYILHTSPHVEPSYAGEIRGLKGEIRNVGWQRLFAEDNPSTSGIMRLVRVNANYVLIVVGASISTTALLFPSWITFLESLADHMRGPSANFIVGLVVICLGVLVEYLQRRKVPKSLVLPR